MSWLDEVDNALKKKEKVANVVCDFGLKIAAAKEAIHHRELRQEDM